MRRKKGGGTAEQERFQKKTRDLRIECDLDRKRGSSVGGGRGENACDLLLINWQKKKREEKENKKKKKSKEKKIHIEKKGRGTHL